ncbi:MAG: M48 family metallopeptidase [Betaproteobacteria bacterium]|nr:MAG: M48 family metallopeptidase [Betaproteobacteria bacterium]
MTRLAGAPEASQLSLFDEPAAPLPAPAAPPASPTPMSPPVETKLVPVGFQHPRAQREIRLGEHLVAYELKRARRRSIGFIVGPEGLSVSAPRWVGQAEIDDALREKARWICAKLHEQHERSKRQLQAKVEWRDGTSIPFLGDTVIVVLDPRVAGAVLNADADALPGVPKLTLHVGLPQQAAPEQIRDAVQSWLQRQARRVFEERCRHFAQALNVRMTRLSLSSASTRWGSASADGSIRLNWRLIHFALPIIDYVVAHELAHLREMNHSPAFWDVVRSVVPDYERSRGSLRDGVVPILE